MDGELLLSINGTALAKPEGASIPSEPSYVIMNTAVSADWGFPSKAKGNCPIGCECECQECGEKECACGITSGFCQELPGHYLVHSVRVYLG